jgi:hypothetical protein
MSLQGKGKQWHQVTPVGWCQSKVCSIIIKFWKARAVHVLNGLINMNRTIFTVKIETGCPFFTLFGLYRTDILDRGVWFTQLFITIGTVFMYCCWQLTRMFKKPNTASQQMVINP